MARHFPSYTSTDSILSVVCDLCAEDFHTTKAQQPKETKQGFRFHVLKMV